ncbi:thioredoxin domain-containing protein [uncultured Serinicoccus sp.]|uniref:DsbA family protein n=1 Tax=uncultured Serinicoccus sp. TaxID=735514 RepID=UPI0026236B60|nr:thioredoxin domain-containing protein [uncultured Serinicoccus sp.]
MPRPPAPAVKPVTARGPSVPLVSGVVLLVVALVGGLVLWAVSRGGGLEAEGSANALPEGGGVRLGASSQDAPQVHVYEDFQCPFCGVLEESVGAELAQRAEAGEISLTVTMMSFLDGSLGNDSSHRAANAALCADDEGAFLDYHAAVFAGQPEQEGAGWTDEQLLGFASEAGLAGSALESFTACTQGDAYGDYVEAMQERANRDGVTGTPRLLVDGEPVDDDQMRALMSGPETLEDVLGSAP